MLKNLVGRIVSMFSQKQSVDEDITYIKFSVRDGDIKIEFGYDEISEFSVLADYILNGKVRSAALDNIITTLASNGHESEAQFFINYVQKSIPPSEFII